MHSFHCYLHLAGQNQFTVNKRLLAARDNCNKNSPTLTVLGVSSQNSYYSCLSSLTLLAQRVQSPSKLPIFPVSSFSDNVLSGKIFSKSFWMAMAMALDDLIIQPSGCLGGSWLGPGCNLWLWNRAKLTGVEPWPWLPAGDELSVACTKWPHSWQGYYMP